jgi:hypothetical protein
MRNGAREKRCENGGMRNGTSGLAWQGPRFSPADTTAPGTRGPLLLDLPPRCTRRGEERAGRGVCTGGVSRPLSCNAKRNV